MFNLGLCKMNLIELKIIFCSIILLSFFIGGLFLDSFGEEESNLPILTDPNLQIKLFQTGLDFPTKMTFVDDETILVAQKYSGKVAVIKNFELQNYDALDLNVEASRERGLIGLDSTNLNGEIIVFVYYTESVSEFDTNSFGKEAEDSKNNGNKIMRYKWNGTSLVDPVLLMHPLPNANLEHSGGAMVIFNHTLFLIIGDNQQIDNRLVNGNVTQPIDNGVILRITFDGEPVPSNPFKDPTLSKYYAYGIRNGYGLDIDPLTNYVWDTENGPKKFDEINLVYPGFNSGWGKIMGPSQEGFFTSDLSELTFFPGSNYSEPEFSWRDTVAPTAIKFFESNKLGNEYQYDAFVGDVYGRLYHFELNEDRTGFIFKDELLDDLVVDTQDESASIIFGKNLGVITDIKTGPDGFLYILSLVKGIEEFENWKRPLISSKVIEKSEFTGVLFRINKNFEVEKINPISPKEQISKGSFPDEVVCKENFELILKLKNNSPSCVTPKTAEKLIARNWGYR